jgi:hypothetical protein
MNGKLTITSTFRLTFLLECAFTIFLTVARGYSFCPPAILRLRMLRAVVVQDEAVCLWGRMSALSSTSESASSLSVAGRLNGPKCSP